MLLATLNMNLPELTDNLVEQLKRDPYFKNCEMMVVDNGSSEPKSKYTTHALEKNVYFGGGFNAVLEYFLTTEHDYLYFLNNDLIFHGLSFLSTSINEAKKFDAAVYSPTVINASIDQCYWKQMWNWGKGVREVKWVDFQCPMIRRDVLELIKRYPEELVYGWGLDIYTGCVLEDTDLKTYVSDTNTICHLNSQTLKQNKSDMSMDEFCYNANHWQNTYFNNSEYREKFYKLRQYGESYVPV